MRRLLPLLVCFLLCAPAAARAQVPALDWQACRGVTTGGAPRLSDCRPLGGVIDPQDRELWLRATVRRPADDRPRALYLIGVASSEAWLNGARIGANGRPSALAAAERPGRFQIALPIRDSAWRPGDNVLVVHMSSHLGGLRLDRPIGAVVVAPYPAPSNAILLAVTFAAAGALFAAAFGFAVIHTLRRTGSSLILALIAGVAALQAVLESLRSLVPYAYPLHVWRLVGIWSLAAAFSVLLVAYVAGRFWPRARPHLVILALVAVGATSLAPGFDLKTSLALLTGVVLAAVAAGVGVRRRQPLAALTLTYLGLFLAIAVAFPDWLVDLSYFLLAAGLVLPLLAAEVVRLGREDRVRETALTLAVDQPDCLTVVSARGVERVPIPDIVAVIGADDYVELRLSSGRSLLHAARLDRLETELPAGFLRVHRSAIANLAQATGLERDGGRSRLLMRVGPALSISRARLATVRAALGV
ncbi:LytTR family DNA-binding domain-containing protein [Caulobacter sp. NIBR1757]|uniref:LytTR family DNA-binding domain-containing protein n=1 Tax=Caulobacter sp. NIBR1757 TaxID=3016000 RepID=UPI0022F0D898|nr:LytTR family DNA-binding domain-containing protein [Caulobacter sp. NIBR1757]WGM39421.1 hypothetical protein AMEJIAPC_02341 [Caulobacter sp. NIBR1757]